MIGKVSAGAWQRQQQPAHTDNFFQASSSSTPTQRRWCRAYLGGAPQRVILNGVGRARAGQWPVGAGVLAEELGVREVTRHSTAGELHSQHEQHCDRHRVAVRWAAPPADSPGVQPTSLQCSTISSTAMRAWYVECTAYSSCRSCVRATPSTSKHSDNCTLQKVPAHCVQELCSRTHMYTSVAIR